MDKKNLIKNCSGCCWLLSPDDSLNNEEEFYRCIRFPPNLIDRGGYEFPIVLLTDRCGEYQ